MTRMDIVRGSLDAITAPVRAACVVSDVFRDMGVLFSVLGSEPSTVACYEMTHFLWLMMLSDDMISF